METILLTGATGFLGSHLCKRLIDSGCTVYATCRTSSSFERCLSFKDNVSWINVDEEDINSSLTNVSLDVVIHSAWEGVSVEGRNDWDLQLKNFEFSKKIFDVSVQRGVKKIIGIGSQAEYGLFSQKVSESHLPEPCDAYGTTKLFTMHYLMNIVKKENISWYWIRVFSVAGEKENSGWLLSLVKNKLAKNETIDLTEGEQSYDYLYVDDFLNRFEKLLNTKEDLSGVYNICSGRAVKIKDLLLLLAEKMGADKSNLNFGKIPYRESQNMFMVGKPDKFEANFGKLPLETMESIIDKIIKT